MLSDSMIAIAKDLIDQFGDTIELSKVEIHGYNPVTHKNDETVTKIMTKGVKESVTTAGYYVGQKLGSMDGVIRMEDMKITMYSEIADIDESWRINGDNILFTTKVGMQDKLIVYDVFVRAS